MDSIKLVVLLVLCCIGIFITVSLLRAKFDKHTFPSKVFYVLLFGGTIIFGLIFSMIIGYSAFGNSDFLLEIRYQAQTMILVFLIFIYPLLLGCIANLDGMIRNIVKIFVVIFDIFIGFSFISMGFFFAMMGNIGNIGGIITFVLLGLVFVIVRYKSKKNYQKIISEILIASFFVFAIIFFTDFILWNKCVANEYEVETLARGLSSEFDSFFGKDKWGIVSYRKSFDKEYEGNVLVKIKYYTSYNVEASESVLYKYDEDKSVIGKLLLNKANDMLPNVRVWIRYNEPFEIEPVKNKNITLDNFDLEKFLSLDNVYVEYDEDYLDLEQVKFYVKSENAKFIPIKGDIY